MAGRCDPARPPPWIPSVRRSPAQATTDNPQHQVVVFEAALVDDPSHALSTPLHGSHELAVRDHNPSRVLRLAQLPLESALDCLGS
jgi:hypothetical protein